MEKISERSVRHRAQRTEERGKRGNTVDEVDRRKKSG